MAEAAARGPALPGVADEQLRPALELAFSLAVDGRKQRPPVAPPEALRPYLRFQKLPTRALGAVRKALDEDATFRERVAAAAEVEAIGVAAHAWLVRPDGWQRTVRHALAQSETDGRGADATASARADRRAERRQDAARQAASELVAVRAQLKEERSARHDAEQRVAEQQRQLELLREEVQGLQRRARRNEEAAGEARAEHQATLRRLDDLEQALADAVQVRDEALAERAELEQALGAEGNGRSAPASPAPAVTAARAAARGAARSLRDTAAALEREAAALEDAIRAVPPSAEAPPSVPAASRSRRAPRVRRAPLALPGGVLSTSVDAATHWLRVPGVELIVDGYNVAMLAWPALELADRRERCIDAVEDIVRRFGTRAVVIFDGADVSVAVRARRLARVEFSPAGVIADEVIRQVVSSLPTSQPVVVATNDREVVNAVRATGANTITSEQLLAAAGRAVSNTPSP